MNPVSRKSVSIMISSCERGDLSELQRVLEETELDIGVEPLYSKGQTALHIACANGHLHIAQYLVNEKECSVMVEDVYGHNPSLINKHWTVADFLLTVAPNSDDFKKHIGLLHYGESLVAKVANEALFNSCSNGYFHLVKFVIKCKKDYTYAYLKDMRTTARSNGQLHIVQLLFKYCEPARDMTLSELHVACIVGDVEKVTTALASHGATVLSKTDWYRMSPLHYASCEPKILSMTMSIITDENKALVNSKDTFGNTPLHYAVLAGCTESVNLLLRAPECDINLVNTKGETPLHLACKQRDIRILEMLATEEICDLNAQNYYGDTAMHIAVKERMPVKYIKELTLHKTCSHNIANHDNMTPLQLALSTDQLSAMKLLLQCICAKCSHEDIAKVIQDLLLRAMHADKIVLLMMLIERKEFNINEINHDGQTFLHVACTLKNMKYIQTLIQKPTCDLNIQDYSGDSALHIAVYSRLNSAEKIQCILECDRCDPNITNKQGYTPLHVASLNSQFDSVRILLNTTKCNPNLQNFQGNTALHLIIHQKSATSVEAFLMCDKVDVNIQNEGGNTPIHVSVITDNALYVIEKLIGHPNCNPSITNHEGMTPLQLAIKTDQLSAAEVLLLSARFSREDIAKAMQGSPCLLHRVIHANMMSLVMILMKINECDINEVNHDGQTPLHVACTAKNVEYIQAIIQYPTCDLNIQDDNRDTALHVAIYSKLYSAEKIQYMLEYNKCDPNITNNLGYTPLHTASLNNQFNSVKVLTNFTKCNPNIQNLQGNTALHLSMHLMSATVAELFLICDNVDVNVQNREGDTPLHVAVIQGAPPHVIRSLTHHEHCNVCIVNNQGMTPLHISLNTKKIAIANIIATKYSCEDRKKMTIEVTSDVLYKAVLENYPSLVQILLDFQSEKVHLNLGFNETALHVACKRGYCDMIEILLEKGADVQAVDNDKYTPLHIVCRSLRLDCLKVLLGNKKCDLNQQIANGDTALHIVCKMVNTDTIHLGMIQILLENGAYVQAVDSSGDAPIHIVCKGLRLDCLKALLQSKGCDVNQQNADGDTALHIVCKMVNIDPMHICKIEILLERGANVQVVNKIGDAPIHIACNGLRLHCLKALLQSRGCDPNQQNADGDTALHTVCKMGDNLDSNMRFIEALISTPGIDPEISNHAGRTPIEVAGTKYFVIQTVTNFLKHKQSSIQTYLKIFVVGNSGTGKSTLIKAVTTEASQLLKYAIFPKMKLVNPSDVPPYTAGIVPISLNSKYFGHAVLYDFAGQHEYYSSHAAVMENLILPSPPLFLLLIDISKPIEDIKEELVYWWQFINNHSQRAAVPPHVMFVGSHKDIVRARGEDPQSIIDEIMEHSVRDMYVLYI